MMEKNPTVGRKIEKQNNLKMISKVQMIVY